IPQPIKLEKKKGQFLLSPTTVLLYTDAGEKAIANFFNAYLKQYYSISLKIASKATTNYIAFKTKKFITAPANDGKYTLSIQPKFVLIEGDTYMGTFYGMQSLIQLLPIKKIKSLPINAVEISDEPRFSYRGMHLDVSRHFYTVEYIKKYIDFLALHKMNYFHWHLTDDQGWRIEIKKYPKLTAVGAYRNGTTIGRYPGTGNTKEPYGKFYTQEDIKTIVQYASDRFITIIPEIEMPGHASAAIAAYPELSCFPKEDTKHPENVAWYGNDKGKQVQQTWGIFEDVFCPTDYTFSFLEDVLNEVMELFPSNYIHIGGDECPKESWKRSKFCQKLIKEKNLKDEHGLQSYFIQRIEKYLNQKGRKIIGWDEILEGGLAPNAIVMSWRGEKGGIEAAQQNHQVIMTPGSHCYFDHSQTRHEDSVTIGSYLPIEKVYAYEPIPSVLNEKEASLVLGAQGNVWTEYITNTAKLEYMVFPRIAALSEVLWSRKENKNWTFFQEKLQQQFKRYQLWKVNYSNAYYDITDSILPTANYNGILWKLGTNDNKATIYYSIRGDGFSAPAQPYKQPVLIQNYTTVASSILLDGKPLKWRYKTFDFNKATGKKITLTHQPSNAYPGNGGVFGLVNGVAAEEKFPSVEWTGWNGKDMEAIIDLGKIDTVSKVVMYNFAKQNSWIYPASEVIIAVSTDGIQYQQVYQEDLLKDEMFQKLGGKIVGDFTKTTQRYIKILVRNFGKIPKGNIGAGNNAWLFIDEIYIN
ncbi:MAG: family 20 glycosylhydrolase, partial [Chitinophagaceae bacterium]